VANSTTKIEMLEQRHGRKVSSLEVYKRDIINDRANLYSKFIIIY